MLVYLVARMSLRLQWTPWKPFACNPEEKCSVLNISRTLILRSRTYISISIPHLANLKVYLASKEGYDRSLYIF